MANVENLKPFKKGESGNPKGRPEGSVSLKTKLKEALQRIHEGTGTRYDELFIQATMKDGIKADGQSRRLIWQYLEGLPQQNLDVTTAGEKLNKEVSSEELENLLAIYERNKQNRTGEADNG